MASSKPRRTTRSVRYGFNANPTSATRPSLPTLTPLGSSVLLLLRVGNAGGYTPSQIHALYRKIEEFTHDIRLTARPASDGGFAINLSGTDGLVPRHSVPQGGQYLYCDTTTIHARALAWLDQVEAGKVGEIEQWIGGGHGFRRGKRAVTLPAGLAGISFD